jgi:tetratricopeptide (TPR) repeat protein
VGLANGYVERADRYGFEESSFDSAADLCRKAIGLDPGQARAYAGLARALNYKGLDQEAHEQTVIALRLAPNDVITNRRAAYDAEMSGRVDEQYALRRKCHELDPNSVEDLYCLARICVWAGDSEAMEKWMGRAVDVETDSQRRLLLKCEKLIFRHDYRNAISGLRDLPLEFFAYECQVDEIFASCSARIGDWDTANKIADLSHSAGWWRLAYPALSEQAAGRDTSMRERAERLIAAIQKAMAGSEIGHWEAFYIAEGKRLLGQKDEAYDLFRSVFSPVIRHLPLMDQDPLLDVFREDPQFRKLSAELRSEIETTKVRIQQLEKSH